MISRQKEKPFTPVCPVFIASNHQERYPQFPLSHGRGNGTEHNRTAHAGWFLRGDLIFSWGVLILTHTMPRYHINGVLGAFTAFSSTGICSWLLSSGFSRVESTETFVSLSYQASCL